MEQKEIKKELLNVMNQISERMNEIIFLNYFDKLGNDKKYILSMMNDAFLTTKVFCYAMQNVCVVQAGLLLRQLLEQVSILYILVAHPETLPKYIEHSKLKREWIDLKKGKQIDLIAERFGVPNKPSALAYLDYGWIGFKDEKQCNEDGMLLFAGFDDILSWRKMFLDKLAHSSFTAVNFLGENKDFPITNNFVEIAAKLFDYLCVAFHNLTKFDFVFDGFDLHKSFIELYSSYHL